MIILRVEKLNMFQNSLYKIIFLCFFCSSIIVSSQELQKSPRKLKKIGILYNRASENNFLFNDADYTYTTNLFKVQFFYLLWESKKLDINLIFQPQIHNAKHQLNNIQFITPDISNFIALRERYSQERTISLLGFELGIQFRRKLFGQLFSELNLAAGIAHIDKETERLASGFTFIENLSLGIAYLFKSSEIYLGANLGHVSNFNFKDPNDGYNVLGFEVGYRILLK